MTESLPAVIFDLDDTLFAEEEYVFSGFQAVSEWAESTWQIPKDVSFVTLKKLHELGVRGNTFDLWIHQVLPAEELRDRLAPRAPTAALDGETAEIINLAVAQAVAVYRSHPPSITPRPESFSILRRLSSQFRLGLVSDGHLATQQAKWSALGLAPLFEAVVFSDSLGREHWKPSPKPYLTVLAQLNVAPSAAIYVGDNPAKDFLGARRAGMASVRVRYEDGVYAKNEPDQPAGQPDFEINSLNGLPEILKTWQS